MTTEKTKAALDAAVTSENQEALKWYRDLIERAYMANVYNTEPHDCKMRWHIENMLNSALTTTQPPQATDAERQAAFSDVVKYLLGEAPLRGHWFGEKHPPEGKPYWWRKHLRETALQSPAVPREVVDALRSAQQALREWREDFTPEVKIQSPAEVLVSRAMTALGCSGEETA